MAYDAEFAGVVPKRGDNRLLVTRESEVTPTKRRFRHLERVADLGAVALLVLPHPTRRTRCRWGYELHERMYEARVIQPRRLAADHARWCPCHLVAHKVFGASLVRV